MTHLELLLHLIKKMDEEMLKEFLPDRLCSQRVSKEAFINKLEEIFFNFKKMGNSTILINDNTCKCENCMALDFEKRSFAFFGNLSGDFFCLDFYIIENKVIHIDNVQDFDLNKVIDMKNSLFEFDDLTKSRSWHNIFFKY